MKTVGQILREAREAKGLTIAQAVEGTRSKSQVIQALERDDFSRFPAPIYTRGFIKLYAEFLGLDASEIISLYQARNADTDKLHRPSSVLKPGASHVAAPTPAAQTEVELPLPPPEPPPAAAAPAAPPPPEPARPSIPEPELPFDRPASPVSAPEPVAVPAAEPPKIVPRLPEAPKVAVTPEPPKAAEAPPPAAASEYEAPVVTPRRKATLPKQAPRSRTADEFALEVRDEDKSETARERAASIFALARVSAGRLPWVKIATRGGLIVGSLLLAWVLLTVIRGCVNRRHAATLKPVAAAPYNLPPAPEPPPLYLPEKLPSR